MKFPRLILFALIISSKCFSQNLVADSLFGTNGTTAFNFINYEHAYRLLELSDGKFLMGGFSNGSGYDIYTALAKFDICGSPDLSFSDDGQMFHSFDLRNTPYDIVEQQTDGKIVCAGQEASSNAGSGQIPFVSRYLANGLPDSSFNEDGFIPQRFDDISSGSFYSVEMYPDGRILCIGLSTGNINGGVNGYGAIRFTSDGALDPNFDGDGIVRYSPSVSGYGAVRGHLLDNEKITFAFSSLSSYPYHFYMTSSAIDSDGALNAAYGTDGLYIDNIAVTNNSFTDLQSDDKQIIASSMESQYGLVVIRLTTTGDLDPAFGNNGHVTYDIIDPYTSEVRGIRVISNDEILVFGVTGARPFIVALNADGSVKTDFGNNGYRDISGYNSFRYTGDILELDNGQLLAAGSDNSDFSVLRLIDPSNVPHVSYDGATILTTGGDFFQWYFNGNMINGSTNDYCQPQEDGYYNVVATDIFGCSYSSDSVLVQNVAVDELSDAYLIKVFPNPVTDYLVIESSNHEMTEIIIYDVSGKELMRTKNPPATTKVPFDFNNGVYLVRVSSEDHSHDYLVAKSD